MIAVIADDEEHVRKGIELAVDWERFGITERLMAGDGLQAMELIREHRPAILFCDMSMPQMDGTELLRMLREEGWHTQVIVVSGYEDFNYTRAAILANGVDYILKPFKAKELEAAVAKAVEAYREIGKKAKDEHESRRRLSLADSLLDEQKLVGYLRGEVSFQDEMVRNLFHKLGLPSNELYLACILPRNKNRLIDQRFLGDLALFHFAISNIAQEVLKAYGSHCLIRLDEYQWIIIASPSSQEKISGEYEWYLHKLEQAWHNTLGLRILVRANKSETATRDLPAAIAEVRASLMKVNLLSNQCSVPAKELPRLADQETVLMLAMQKGNKRGVTNIIEAYVQQVQLRGTLSLEELQVCTLEANILLKRAASLGLTVKERTDWLLPLWISDLSEWKSQLLHRCWEMAEATKGDYKAEFQIETVRRYIEQNYNENISLLSLSERFHFSPRYLAKMFKEQFQTTIISNLTELRVEKAKSLLIHSEAPVSEVAGLIGYEDENYFGKVFKKQTGLSPMQYRKQYKNHL
ncbi:response regulator [Paenibacillaceae bacterium WGS1546]|uniref:response regulator n=1 Tax=Cohnella sp. WGS1546 TaxID=3366810 RepID=UPI00372D2950